MPFYLINSISTFMGLMNLVLKCFLSRFVVVYFDNNLVYRKDEDDHANYFQQVLELLSYEKLYENLKKSHFFTS